MRTILQMKDYMKLFLCGILVVFVIVFSGFVWGPKKITIIADGKTHVIQTHQPSVYSALIQAGITLGDRDTVKVDMQSLQDGATIAVIRAFPVTVEVKGAKKTVMTTARTAQELAEQLNFNRPYYAVIGDAKAKLEKNSTVKIGMITRTATHNVMKEIGIETIQEPDDTMAKGDEKLVQEGKPGLAQVREEVLYDGNTVLQTKVLTMSVTKKMVPRIVKVGTRENTVTTSRGVMRYARILKMHATAYIPSDGNGDGITATGIPATRGVVAVDPDVIPLGSRLYIPGYGLAIAADTGGAIIGNRIDLLMDSYYEAMNFGRQNIEVYVLQ